MKNHQQHSSIGSRETRVSTAAQGFEIRTNADGSRTISGTAVVFGALSENLGGFRERIAAGAFTQSLRDNADVLILAQHNLAQPLGRVSSGTAKVWQDERGLHFSCTLPETSWARDLVALLQRGDVRQMSFGFAVPPGGDEWTTEPDGLLLRTVNMATVYECSVVTAPAYAQTSVSLRSAPAHIKAQLQKEDDGQRGDFNFVRYDLGDDAPDVGDDGNGESGDDDLDGCECRCAPCQEDRCADCDNPLCTEDNCATCPVQVREAHFALLMRRLR